MKNSKSVLKTAVLVILLIILVNPGMNPLLSDGVKNATIAELQATFGMLVGGTTGVLSPAKLMTVAAVVIFMWIATNALCFILEKLSKGRRRSQTVASLTISVIKVVGAIAASVWILKAIGVDISTIFASLGIMSLIIGFGVQSLIEDCVTGLFIIFEGIYNIGDIIVLDTFRGTVEKIKNTNYILAWR